MLYDVLSQYLTGLFATLIAITYPSVISPILIKFNHFLNRDNGYLGKAHSFFNKFISKIVIKSGLNLNHYVYEFRIGYDTKGKLTIVPSEILQFRVGTFNRITGTFDRNLANNHKVVTSVTGNIVKTNSGGFKYLKFDEFYIINKTKKEYSTAYYHPSDCNHVGCDLIGISTEFHNNSIKKCISILSSRTYNFSNDLRKENPILDKYLGDFNIEKTDFQNLKKINYR
ncbi:MULTISPECIES: hypothetical protein [unclassified Croceitalea]|uniref:hypothetical protein n=1 Tax=unclassified Croceitalea TaxID=2632280 RepID=UPI0030D9D874